VVVATLFATSLACAEPLSPDAARRFVAGKLFAFNCFDGSRGAGRIYGDGSVIGTIQFRGAGPVRSVWLPAGTLGAKGAAGCAPRGGLPLRAVLHREEAGWPRLRRLVVGFCLLRLPPPHERCRHKPAPAFVPAAVARRGRGDWRRRLTLRLEFDRPVGARPACKRHDALLPASIDFHARLGYGGLPIARLIGKLGAKFARRQAPRGQRLCSSRTLRRSKACTHKSGSASAAPPCPLR